MVDTYFNLFHAYLSLSSLDASWFETRRVFHSSVSWHDWNMCFFIINTPVICYYRHGGVATIDANYQTSLDLSLNYEPREELPPAPSQEHDDNEDNVG